MVEIMKRTLNGKKVVLEGRRWFQKLYGNTYHTVKVSVNDETFYSDITYGYGNHFEQTAIEVLKENGFDVPEYGAFQRLEGFESYVIDVTRRKDLTF